MCELVVEKTSVSKIEAFTLGDFEDTDASGSTDKSQPVHGAWPTIVEDSVASRIGYAK